jgi:hypothetical protein
MLTAGAGRRGAQAGLVLRWLASGAVPSSVAPFSTDPAKVDPAARDHPSLSASVLHRYRRLVADGALTQDASQERAATRLEAMCLELQEHGDRMLRFRKGMVDYEARVEKRKAEVEVEERRRVVEARGVDPESIGRRGRSARSSGGGSFFGWLSSAVGLGRPTLDGRGAGQRSLEAAVEAAVAVRLLSELGPAPEAPATPRGVYLYGHVGTGKTLLLDVAYAAACEAQGLARRRRLHFNSAMMDLHSRMHAVRQVERARRLEMESGGVQIGGGKGGGAWDRLLSSVRLFLPFPCAPTAACVGCVTPLGGWFLSFLWQFSFFLPGHSN